MTLFDRVFSGNDAVYGLTQQAVENAAGQYGEEKAVSLPDTAYGLPCYYAVTGTKNNKFKRNERGASGYRQFNDKRTPLKRCIYVRSSYGPLCGILEALKYVDGAQPYEQPLYGHLPDAAIRELGVPLVTGDIPRCGCFDWKSS